MFFFAEASLAHETARTLRDLGDLAGAERHFVRSVRTRRAATFTRTHAVTLSYLGSVRFRQGGIDGVCESWSVALGAMDGVRSGRTRQIVLDMRSALAPYRRRPGGAPSLVGGSGSWSRIRSAVVRTRPPVMRTTSAGSVSGTVDDQDAM
ncbi:hypothetical protein [Jiangella gansuensis]|uniref:hypothetical protein n=1 Tax=Jiangella gansuensis TaxID=281473 RepID=UPI0012F91AEF|nr:hypothetical protein [Jiangella gansuensis]